MSQWHCSNCNSGWWRKKSRQVHRYVLHLLLLFFLSTSRGYESVNVLICVLTERVLNCVFIISSECNSPMIEIQKFNYLSDGYLSSLIRSHCGTLFDGQWMFSFSSFSPVTYSDNPPTFMSVQDTTIQQLFFHLHRASSAKVRLSAWRAFIFPYFSCRLRICR